MNNAFLTNFLTENIDPQFNKQWKKTDEEEALRPLMFSYKNLNLDNNYCLEVLHEEGNDKNPYFQRWYNCLDYLKNNKDVGYVFCIDATDVIIQRNPFPDIIDGLLYCGSQNDRVGCEWITRNHQSVAELKFSELYKGYTLLNAGILGGDVKTVKRFIQKLIEVREKTKKEQSTMTDMCIFNLVAWTHFKNRIYTGEKVHTQFGAFAGNDKSWFKHK